MTITVNHTMHVTSSAVDAVRPSATGSDFKLKQVGGMTHPHLDSLEDDSERAKKDHEGRNKISAGSLAAGERDGGALAAPGIHVRPRGDARPVFRARVRNIVKGSWARTGRNVQVQTVAVCVPVSRSVV